MTGHQSEMLNTSKGKRGSKNAASQPRKKVRSWQTDLNDEGKSSLDLIVEWLTTNDNYQLWRGGSKSKREVSEMIVKYLAQNGIED